MGCRLVSLKWLEEQETPASVGLSSPTSSRGFDQDRDVRMVYRKTEDLFPGVISEMKTSDTVVDSYVGGREFQDDVCRLTSVRKFLTDDEIINSHIQQRREEEKSNANVVESRLHEVAHTGTVVGGVRSQPHLQLEERVVNPPSKLGVGGEVERKALTMPRLGGKGYRLASMLKPGVVNHTPPTERYSNRVEEESSTSSFVTTLESERRNLTLSTGSGSFRLVSMMHRLGVEEKTPNHPSIALVDLDNSAGCRLVSVKRLGVAETPSLPPSTLSYRIRRGRHRAAFRRWTMARAASVTQLTRHLDKGSDLVEAAGQCSGESRADGARGSLKDLAKALKQHLRGFGERLEDTRERLEDTSRCFYLLDKAYEWALETMKYLSRVGVVEEVQTADQAMQMTKMIQQYLMAHPCLSEDHFQEMLQLAAKLGNDKLQQQAKVAHSRCQETLETIRTQQSRLVQLRRMLGGEEERPTSPKPSHQGWKPATSTPISAVGRRRSVGSNPYIYKCSHHAAGHNCSCWDPAPSPVEECCCGNNARNNLPFNLGNIQEVRESAEDLLDATEESNSEKRDELCGRCSGPVDSQSNALSKRQLRRSCTWQYPTENFDEERLSGGDDHSGDNTTEGSEGCAKSRENGDDLEDQELGNKTVPPVPVNSHLHCNGSTLDLSTSLAVPGTTQHKTHKTLLYIMREMIQTERDYVKSLEYIIENYIPELLREDIPQAMRGQRNVIFGNVEKIYEFHSQYFLQELEKCENSPLQVGQSFLRHEKKFYLYALYNKNKPKSDALMSEYGTSFFKAKQVELGDKMDLASYLLKPVQRMGKYALLLQQLVKACSEKVREGEKDCPTEKGSDIDTTDMKAADKMVRFQLRHGNDLLAMDSLRDCDVNVKEQGRLLRQNEFLVWQGKGKKCLRHVFLFEELILFSKARRFPDRKNLDLYIYKNSIKMTDIGLTAKIGDSPTKFEIWFRKRKPNDTFTIQSMSEEIKQAWTEELSKLLWKQALRNRETRLAEMSSMGIGNKPCLDIRPSKDQINDRSISFAQLSKTAPRFRHSITIPPGELTRSNKRPHSIISVSSSSSSGGSSTSHSSNYGALINLGFDPADSPRLHHRSATLNSQCSMESGIIADISLGSEDTDSSGTHWSVERSNSSATSTSLDSAVSPTSPSEEANRPIAANTEQQEFYIKL